MFPGSEGAGRASVRIFPDLFTIQKKMNWMMTDKMITKYNTLCVEVKDFCQNKHIC